MLWLVVAALCWCSAGMVLWNGARAVCYHVVRVHQQRKCDTLYVDAALLKGRTASLVWVKKDEIRYMGKMFDIKRTVKHSDGKIGLIGHYDKTEDKLFKILRKLVGNERQQDMENPVPSVWSFTAILPQVQAYHTIPFVAARQQTCAYISRAYAALHQTPPAPPPDVVA